MRQQVRADGVDGADAQWRGQLILALFRNRLDRAGLLEHPLRLADDLLAYRGHAHFPLAPLEQADTQLFLELLHRHAQGRLTDKAGLGSPPEVALAGYRDNVFQLIECHN